MWQDQKNRNGQRKKEGTDKGEQIMDPSRKAPEDRCLGR